MPKPGPIALKRDARLFLSRELEGATKRDQTARISAIRQGAWVPETDENKQHLIALALGLTILYAKETDFLKALHGDRFGKTNGHDAARVFVEALYAVQDPNDRRLPKSLSSWTNAVRHLRKRGILASTVAQLVQNGEGIDQWSKAEGRRKQVVRQHHLKKNATKPARINVKVGKDTQIFHISRSDVLETVLIELKRLADTYPDPNNPSA